MTVYIVTSCCNSFIPITPLVLFPVRTKHCTVSFCHGEITMWEGEQNSMDKNKGATKVELAMRMRLWFMLSCLHQWALPNFVRYSVIYCADVPLFTVKFPFVFPFPLLCVIITGFDNCLFYLFHHKPLVLSHMASIACQKCSPCSVYAFNELQQKKRH